MTGILGGLSLSIGLERCAKLSPALVEWIPIRNSSGSSRYFLLACRRTCCAARRRRMYFISRLRPASEFLRRARLGGNFWDYGEGVRGKKIESIQHPTSNFTHKTSLQNGSAYPRTNAALSMARTTPPRSQISMARSNESGSRRSPPTIRKEFARISHSQRKYPEKKATTSKTL